MALAYSSKVFLASALVNGLSCSVLSSGTACSIDLLGIVVELGSCPTSLVELAATNVVGGVAGAMKAGTS